MNLFEMPKIGIIGLGFVGSAIQNSYDSFNLVLLDPAKGYNATYQELMECEGIFICVPSPQSDDGSCNTSILENVLENLKEYKGVIISKCTVPPAVYERLGKKYLNLVHAPEFLTAANAKQDYLTGTFAFIGSSVRAYSKEAERLIRGGQTNLQTVVHCTLGEASLAKYTINSFLATKVVFMNELHKLAESLNLNYNTISQMISLDERIGKSHLQVPGPDGACGFGGMCFPKDTSALLKFAEEVSAPMNVLESAVKKNTLLRLTEPK